MPAMQLRRGQPVAGRRYLQATVSKQRPCISALLHTGTQQLSHSKFNSWQPVLLKQLHQSVMQRAHTAAAGLLVQPGKQLP